MAPSPLRDRVKAVPFVPFTVTLLGGRKVLVFRPDMILLGRRMATVAFVDQDGYDRIVVMRHTDIVAIDAADLFQPASIPE